MILAIIFLGFACVMLAIGGIFLTRWVNVIREHIQHLDYKIKDMRYSIDYLTRRVEHLEKPSDVKCE